MSKSEDNTRSSLSILVMCVIGAIICIIALVMTAPAKAQERPRTYNENLITDFIEADRMCIEDNQDMCARVEQLCALMTTQRIRELHRFIWNEYPFKSKNGAMNITTRFRMALRKC